MDERNEKNKTGCTKEENLAVKVSVVTITINAILFLVKLAAGIIGRSSAMISDAVHSASDVFSTLVVIAGMKMAGKKADSEHPYGHERMESVAAILLAILLAVVGLGIGAAGVEKIAGGRYHELEIPGMFALTAAILSMAVKEWMFWYTRAAAKKLHSGALMADAWHHRSDALSSVGSFVGILCSRLGFPVMDAVAGVIISFCILKAAYDIFQDGLNQLVDHSCDKETECAMRALVLTVPGVQGIDDFKTRLFGSKLFVDIEILADGGLELRESHEIAEQVHHLIEQHYPECKHCMVHMNPILDEETEE